MPFRTVITAALIAMVLTIAPSAVTAAQSSPDAVTAFRAEASHHGYPFVADEAASSVADEIARRVAVDQLARAHYSRLMRGTAEDAAEAQALGREILDIDAANTAYLKTVIPSDGWFRNSRDGETTTSGAWLLVQHSPDRALMATVLTHMEPLARMGEVNGRDFALLFDRVAMFEGRPQRYGSQVICREGVRTFHTIEDESAVDALRASVGHPDTMAETAARLRVGQSCG
jgi:hypothetical protein